MCRRLMTIPLGSTTMGCRDINKIHKNKKTERGSITLEAAIFLTLFILFYIAMMDLIQIAKAQVLLQYSINEAAKEISVYSYVMTKAGFTEKRLETYEKAASTRELVDGLEKLGNALSSGDMETAFNEASDVKGKIENIDVNELPTDLFNYFKSEVHGVLDDAAVELIVESEVRKQIEQMSAKDPDRFLKDLGISEGMAGLKFTGSSWAQESAGDGIPVLKVVVTYTIDFHLGYLELEPRTYSLCAKTAIW